VSASMAMGIALGIAGTVLVGQIAFLVRDWWRRLF
jgi:hypothetical protein